MTKRCTNCFKEKPTAQFYRKLNRWQSRCKDCNAEVCRAYRQQKTISEIRAKFARLRDK